MFHYYFGEHYFGDTLRSNPLRLRDIFRFLKRPSETTLCLPEIYYLEKIDATLFSRSVQIAKSTPKSRRSFPSNTAYFITNRVSEGHPFVPSRYINLMFYGVLARAAFKHPGIAWLRGR